MKKFAALICAFLLFIGTVTGVNFYFMNSIKAKQTELIYRNQDERNFSIDGMQTILTDTVIPVLGSSELSAADEVAYPPVLFNGGASDYNMVLIGRGSMQSLHHAISIGSIAPLISNKKVVLILSPQWFTAEHLNADAYASRFSERMYAGFLRNPNISKQTKQNITDRVKQLITADPKQLKRIEKYEDVFLEHTLNLFKYFEIGIYDKFMNMKQRRYLADIARGLPINDSPPIEAESINFTQLMQSAAEAGMAACTNNDLFIYDEYYDLYVREGREGNKNANTASSYIESPEYGDLRLFLDVCKESEIQPLIISIPVNGRWYDWTGFPVEERQGYYQKIRDICQEYQVEICDFSDKEYEPYFLKDIMHLGWKGWVYLDEAVYEFYKEN